ncbi:arginase family protein [Dawidia soli]|uniref:Arginase family protein n=1 Tax=Dawidia soli TaxID=2782352 RepID=A0AAP2GHF0_9BACT|nr:arginase family protein [Dawidia soli]MBT1685928.1 arginase family protein [Dawidia soli]
MKTCLLSVPYDSGHHRKRLAAGPPILIDAVAQQLPAWGHRARKAEVFVDTPFATEVTTSFAVARAVAEQVAAAKQQGEFPLVFTGNCNAAALGVLSGLQEDLGVIWFDCHGDFNTPETTIGGYLDGMALSIVAGQCWTPLAESIPGYAPVAEDKIILAGARDVDALEGHRLAASAVRLITPATLAQPENAFDDFRLPAGKIYLHLDLDVLDPDYARVNEYSTPGGLSPETLYRAIDSIRHRYTIAGVGITAYDPSLDPHARVPEVAVEAIRRILA